MMVNLNTQPLVYDFRRMRYQPDYIYDCGHCHMPLESLRDAFLVHGNFHNPGMAALLCGRCAKLYWESEMRAMKAAEESGY